WHPYPKAVAKEVHAFAPDRVILLPLYPQFSSTTTGSFLDAWDTATRNAGLDWPTSAICCYPSDPGFVSAVIALTRDAIERASKFGNPRVLFSAHGLPQKIVDAGDPYQDQAEQTVAAIAARMELASTDYTLCYQSRVGRLEWVRPYIDDEIRKAAEAGMPLVVVPIAFVSEHSETLVELDIEYGRMARDLGAPTYERAATVGAAPDFIRGLAGLVRQAMSGGPGRFPGGGVRACANGPGGCPNA
ncbi:MAG: ferrochelatase, partial [Rhodospirillales bacterium]|nr:ferrochelatase [Rhodospirillales bacterium]